MTLVIVEDSVAEVTDVRWEIDPTPGVGLVHADVTVRIRQFDLELLKRLVEATFVEQ